MKNYKIEWLVENRVIALKYFNESTTQELWEQDEIILRMLEGCPNLSVHFLIDAAQEGGSPDFQTLAQLKHPRHPALGWTIITSVSNKYRAFVASLTAQLVGSRVQIRDTRQEALQFLNELDSTLPNLEEVPYPFDEAAINDAATA